MSYTVTIDYDIIEANGRNAIIKLIRVAIAEGWSPIGGVIKTANWYEQTVVRYKQVDSPDKIKALRRRDSKEWLARIGEHGELYTGQIPELFPVTTNINEIIRYWEEKGGGAGLSDYEEVMLSLNKI